MDNRGSMKVSFVTEFTGLEPLGIMSLSAYAKKYGHSTELFDIKLQKDWKQSLIKFSPDVVCYSITTGLEKKYLKINSELKKEIKFLSFFGGMHATFKPNFIEEESVDVLCRGEGEIQFAEMLNRLRENKNIADIKGLWVKKEDKIYKNEMTQWEQDLDSFPPPDREILNKYKVYQKMTRRTVMTMRGCTFTCTYCFNPGYNKLYEGQKILRRRSVDHVIDELKELKKNGAKRIQFVDDVFIFMPNWVFDFCEKYKKLINLPFTCYLRIEMVTSEIAKALANAGCTLVLFAIETANTDIRLNLLKRYMSDDQIIKGAALLKQNKIKLYTQNMVGLPNETIEDTFKTIDLNRKINTDYAWVSIFQPYPGTELGEISLKMGLITKEQIDFPESYYNNSILKGKQDFVRLQCWFPLAVRNRFAYFISKKLIKLPFDRLYHLMWNFYRAYVYLFRIDYMSFDELFGMINK